ncbi:MAG: enoyl-CoA hydratase/isomerase family protein [Acidimicrobiales bacterium]
MTDATPDPEELVLYRKDPSTRIATITLNRPERLNAPTIGMRLRYADLLHQANVDDEVKVLVVRGEGDDFGTGQDLPEYMAANNSDDGLLEELRLEGADVTYPPLRNFRHGATATQWFADPRGGCRTLQEFKKISIVEAKGYVYGWHFYQAGDADLVISSDDALFGHAAAVRLHCSPHVVVGDHDGPAQVPGDGLHRPTVHRRRDGRSSASSTASCPATSSRPRSRSTRWPAPRTVPRMWSSCRRRSSRS